MRLLLVFFLAVSLFGLPAWAQTGAHGNAALYEITDVPVDITADSAAHARDQAIIQAQHSAFGQLLGRLGADSALATTLDDDTLSGLVQSFEVQDEHTSSVRYIGTFTVQFRPSAVRELLAKNGVSYTEAVSKPIIVLPVLISDGHPVLWEEHTQWWAAWENEHGGLVPVILPAGGLDDISVLSTEEAVDGNADAIKAFIGKYQAGGLAVVTLNGDLDNPGPEFQIDIVRYDSDGRPSEPVHLTLPAAANNTPVDATLAQAVHQVRAGFEGNWRQSATKTARLPSMRLIVTVPTDTLAQWTVIKRKLGGISTVDQANVIALARGASNIELQFHGDIAQLQSALAQQDLALTQDSTNGVWTLQSTAVAPSL